MPTQTDPFIYVTCNCCGWHGLATALKQPVAANGTGGRCPRCRAENLMECEEPTREDFLQDRERQFKNIEVMALHALSEKEISPDDAHMVIGHMHRVLIDDVLTPSERKKHGRAVPGYVSSRKHRFRPRSSTRRRAMMQVRQPKKAGSPADRC